MAGFEPDKGALSDKETARIKAIAGPYGTGGEPPDGDKMVTIFSLGKLMEKIREGFQTPLSLVIKPVISRQQSLFMNTTEGVLDLVTKRSQVLVAETGSNPRLSPWQGRAPPTEPLAHVFCCRAKHKK